MNLIEDAQGQEDLVHLISSASDEVNVISPLVLGLPNLWQKLVA